MIPWRNGERRDASCSAIPEAVPEIGTCRLCIALVVPVPVVFTRAVLRRLNNWPVGRTGVRGDSLGLASMGEASALSATLMNPSREELRG